LFPKKYKKITTLAAVLFLAFTIVLSLNVKTNASATAGISYTVSKSTVNVGDTFDIVVNASNVANLYGASIDFKYDQTLLQITSIVKGNAFNGRTTHEGTPINNPSTGNISFYISMQGDVPGFNLTSGTLFVIKAKALKAGSVTLNTISNNNSLSNTGNNVRIKLSDSNASAIGYTATSRTVNITEKVKVIEYASQNGRYEETSPFIHYEGTWRNSTDGTVTQSSVEGSAAEFYFTGTAISLYGIKAPSRGHADIFINGNLEATIDTYSSTVQLNTLLFEKTNLPSGNHVIKVVVKGTKHSASTGIQVSIDAFVLGSAPVVEPPKPHASDEGRYEQNSSFASYTGTWRESSDGTVTQSSTAGSTAEFYFSGTAIRLFGIKAPSRGQADIFIDGVFETTIDTYSPTVQLDTLLFEKTNLATGNHVIQVVVKGTKNPAASNIQISIDAFVLGNAGSNPGPGPSTHAPIPGRYEETSQFINYNGTWRASSDATVMQSTTAGSTAEFYFIGTSVHLYGIKAASRGQADIFINGVFETTIDTYSPTVQLNTLLFEKTGLTHGNHEIKVVVKGTKNPAASGTQISIDAFEFYNSRIVAYAPSPGRYEETSQFITYTGTWRESSDKTVTQSLVAGSTAEFHFTGSSVKLYGIKAASRGHADIFINGVFETTIDTYSPTVQLNTLLFEKTGLPEDNHVIRVVVKGTKNPAASNIQISIDAFEIQ
jgi:trimeric autotransporter adhesin